MTRGVLGRKDGERMSGSSRSRGRALRADASPPCLTPAPEPISRRATVHVFAELVQLPAAGPQDSAVTSRRQPTGRCSALRRARSGRHLHRDADCIAKGVLPLVCLPSLFPPPFSIIKKGFQQRAEVLPCVPKDKEVATCLPEKTRVLDVLSGVSLGAAGHVVNVNESQYRFTMVCFHGNAHRAGLAIDLFMKMGPEVREI